MKGKSGLDPMISYSFDPNVAIGFSSKTESKGTTYGRVLVASVPESEIVRDCGEKIPVPGRVWDPGSCKDTGQYADEREVDAILYLSPDYAWKSLQSEAESQPENGSSSTGSKGDAND